jgi:GNAT superfamily N-acetyltransferase
MGERTTTWTAALARDSHVGPPHAPSGGELTMPRRLRPMTAADLALLPDPCARCTFWEVSLGDLAAPDLHRDRAQLKREWADAVSRRWGYCGVIATEGDELLGYATMAPAQMVPRLGALDAVHPINPDAAVLLSTRVEEPYRGRGLGRQLIQAAAGLMVRRDIRAIEAVGSYREGPSCISPVDFLQRVGFSVIRQHPVTPRLRMDLQATARWLPDLGAAWNRLAGLMPQPAPGAEPAHRQAAGHASVASIVGTGSTP